MKQILIVLLMTISIQYSFSQIPKGTIMAGGSLSLYGTKSRYLLDSLNFTNRFLNVQFQPQVGIFFKDNWVVGISPFFAVNNESNQGFIYSRYQFGLDGFIKKYFQINEKFYFNLGASIQGRVFRNYHPIEITGKSSSLGFAIHPGLTYFITPKIALETQVALLKITNTFSKSGGFFNDHTIDYNLNLDLTTVHLGLMLYLGRQKE